MKKTALLIVTLDTKGPEALFLKNAIERRGVHVLVMDTGIYPSVHGEGDISRREVALAGGGRSSTLSPQVAADAHKRRGIRRSGHG